MTFFGYSSFDLEALLKFLFESLVSLFLWSKLKLGNKMYKSLLTLLGSLIIMTLFTGCGQPNRPILTPVDDLTNKTVVIKQTIPFKKDAIIQASIRTECNIQSQLANFVKEYSQKEGVTVILDNTADKSSEYFLDLVIVGAISQGNPFIGHNKSTSVQGILYKKGNKIASFSGFRHSNGGFGAGFKGSCSVLGRTVDALGKDISVWLKTPTLNDYIGQ